MSVATWFMPVPCIGFTVLSSNGWADLLASRVSPFENGKKRYGHELVLMDCYDPAISHTGSVGCSPTHL